MDVNQIVDYAVFAIGCAFSLLGGVALLTGRSPSRLKGVGKPRYFGVWALSIGIFCITQLPVLRNWIVEMGDIAIIARVMLMVIAAVALLAGIRRNRPQR
ncbi:hypothetical protein [Streptomyces geranii]|uniref:hypothetical protein n=1 Tax=Streptomyces geranii TaxID=2058923 RepID=UPI000D038AC0|nr:hypothetical protein [Streptomyces geranii]